MSKSIGGIIGGFIGGFLGVAIPLLLAQIFVWRGGDQTAAGGFAVFTCITIPLGIAIGVAIGLGVGTMMARK